MSIYRARLNHTQSSAFYLKHENNTHILGTESDTLLASEWRPVEVELFEEESNTKVSDFVTLGLPHMPVLNSKAWKVLQPYFEGNIELLPLIYHGGEFYLIRVTTVLDCIDTSRSTIERWPATGKIKRVRPLVLNQSCVGDTPIFLIKDWEVSGVCISDEVKEKIEENGLTGLEFKPIEMG